MSTRPWVCDSSGERFKVQLMKIAPRSLKSHRSWLHISSCLAFNATIVYYQNNYMDAFDRRYWNVKPIVPSGRVYEFQAAVITPRTS